MNPNSGNLSQFKPSHFGRPRFFRNGGASGVSGWTLIELIVVILMLGILVVISIQALADARETTREGAANAMVRVLNQAQTRAYLANENPFIKGPATIGTNVVTWPITVVNPSSDKDAVDWYLAKGLLRPSEVDEALLPLIQRHPITMDNEGGIWRRVP